MKRATTVLALLGALGAGGSAAAAPFGATDTSFSGDGWAALTSGTAHFARAQALLRQPDGGLVSAGFATVGAERRIALTRHTGAGDLDAGFGAGGSSVLAAGDGRDASAKGIHRRPDGSFLVVAEVVDASIRKLGLGTFSQSGQPVGGFTLHAITADGSTQIRGSALAANGDVLVTGSARDGATSRRTFVARLTPAGDLVFKRLLILGDGTSSEGQAVREEPSGAISVLGGASEGGIGKAFAVRLTAAGARDASFGTKGAALHGIPGRTVSISAGGWGAGGRHILGGSSASHPPTGIGGLVLLIRLRPDGSLDTDFSGDGVLETADEDGNVDGVGDLAELPDGRIAFASSVAIGSSPLVGGIGAGVVTHAGAPDPSFDGNGFKSEQIGDAKTVDADGAAALVLDGPALAVAGWIGRNVQGGVLQVDTTFALARYDLTGARTGLAITALGATSSVDASDTAIAGDGSVFVAGHAVKDLRLEWSVWKLNAGGLPDPAWSADGLAANALPDEGSSAQAVLPADGLVYAGGHSSPAASFTRQGTVVRYLADGTLDPAFGGGDGIVTIDVDGAGDTASSCTGTPSFCRDDDGTNSDGSEVTQLLALAGGDIMAIGVAGDVGIFDDVEPDRILLARLNPDGSPDAGFGTGGTVQLHRSGATGTTAHSAAELPAGKLLLPIGYGPGGQPTVLRLDAATGALDPSFDADGHASIPASGAFPDGSTIFADGSVLTFSSTNSGYDLHRFGASGAQDATFGGGGVLTHTRQALGASLNPGLGTQLPDGTIVTAAGALSLMSPEPAFVFGFTAAGAVRADFGTNGLLGTTRSCGSFTTRALAAGADGKLIVVGTGLDPLLGGTIGVTRYADGPPSTPIGCPPIGGFAAISGSGPYTCAPTPGSLGGSEPFTFAYQWVREATAIAGATASAYAPTADDAGHRLTCRMTVSNPYGSKLVGGNVVTVPGTPYVEVEQGPDPVTPDPEPTPSPSPEPTASPTPEPTAAPSTPASSKPPALPPLKGSAAFTLPSTKKCVSRRKFRIRLKNPKGTKLVSAVVRVNGKKVRTVKGRRLTAPVDLRGLPKGRFTVRVQAVAADGRKVSETRRYRTCAPRKKRRATSR